MRIGITLTSSLEVDQKYIELTKNVAKMLAHQGHGVVYGGTAYGMMITLAETYKQEGGKDLCGVLAEDLMNVTKNYKKFEHLDEEHVVKTMEDRKNRILSLSDAYIVLPGGYGTFEEIGSIIGGQVNKLYSKPIAFYNYEGFYDTLFNFFSEIYDKKFSKIPYKSLFFSSDTMDEILEYFLHYSKKDLADKFVK